MNRTDLSTSVKKPKLPRKRKKAAIKVQGRKWYHDTIKFHKIMASMGCAEPVCKFWVNASIKPKVVGGSGKMGLVPMATKFW